MCSSESTGTNTTDGPGPVYMDEDLQFSQIMDRTSNPRVITCLKCGESDQKSSQYQCRSCKRLLELHDEAQLRSLGSAVASLTRKYDLIWKVRGIIQEDSAKQAARATRHWISAVENGFSSIRDRYYKDNSYRAFLTLEGVGVDFMEYMNGIGDPTRGATA